MTKLLSYNPLGSIKGALISLFKLGLIFALLTGLLTSEVSYAASPVASSSRRHPPHNGSMFGKRSNLMPIVGWSRNRQLQQLPSYKSFEEVYDPRSMYQIESPRLQLPTSHYQAKIYSTILDSLIGSAFDQCNANLRYLGKFKLSYRQSSTNS